MMKKVIVSIGKKIIKSAAVNSANSTTSGTLYQPVAPESLKKLSKIQK